MAKAKNIETVVETEKESTPITVTIHINVNGRIVARTISDLCAGRLAK